MKEKTRTERPQKDSSKSLSSNESGNVSKASFKAPAAEKFHVKALVKYIEAESRPEENHYFFGYQITIVNMSDKPAQLVSRHWIICDGNSHVEEVRGAGVVGLQPMIQPGESFEYESACPLNTNSGSMRGYYQMVGDNGDSFEIEIPEFYLLAPSALH